MGAIDALRRRRNRDTPQMAALQVGAHAPTVDALDIITPDQDRARVYSGRIPIIRETIRTAATLAAACTLRVETLDPTSGRWEPSTDPVAAFALASYRPKDGTQASLITREIVLRERLGEAWRVQHPNPNGPNWWTVHDPLAVTRQGDRFLIARNPAGSGRNGGIITAPRELVQRVWDPDDTYDLYATSPVFGVLDQCELYIAVGRNTKRRLLSRLAGASKLLYTPGEAHTPLAPSEQRPGGPTTDIEQLLLTLSTSNAGEMNDANVGAVAPPHIHWPTLTGTSKSGIEVVDLGDQLDEQSLALRADLRLEIAQGLPWPTQLVLDGPGAGGNHWGDWLADDKAIQQIKARLTGVCDGVTSGVVRPILATLAAAGLWDGDPERVRVGFDPTPITQDPNNFEQLNALLREGVIGPGPVLREVGLGEGDLASPAERAAVLEFVTAGKPSAAVPVSDGRPPEPAKNQAVPPIVTAAATAPPPARAARAAPRKRRDSQSVPDRLLAEDRRYRIEVSAAFGTAFTEAFRRAAVRLQSKAQRKGRTVQAAARAAADSGVFDDDTLAAVGVDRADLFRDSFQTLAETVEAMYRGHRGRQRAILRLLAGDLVDDAEWDVSTDRRATAIGGWLPGAATVAAVGALTSGNVDMVPGGLVAATVRAGNGAAIVDGAVDSPTPGRPDDAVGVVDPDLLGPMTTAGYLPLYQWVYGPDDARGTPFLPHRELDGVRWDDDNRAEVLANPNDFPDTPEYFDGDHVGCQCLWEVVWEEGIFGDFGPDDITEGGGS